jgi:FK506-binding nuclear protein
MSETSSTGGDEVVTRFWGQAVTSVEETTFVLTGTELHVERATLISGDRALIYMETPFMKSRVAVGCLTKQSPNLEVNVALRATDGQVTFTVDAGLGNKATVHLTGEVSMLAYMLVESDDEESEGSDEQGDAAEAVDADVALAEAEEERVQLEAKRSAVRLAAKRKRDAEERARVEAEAAARKAAKREEAKAEAMARQEAKREEAAKARKEKTLEKKREAAKKAEAKKEAAKKSGGDGDFKPLPGGRGLRYRDVQVGGGRLPTAGKQVLVSYVGKFPNGKVFDSNNNFRFRLGVGEVIRGWDLAVAAMPVGTRRQIIVPPELAYGRRGAPPTIPSNATLLFEVTLKSAK